jgi:VanZ family protein
MLRLFAWLLLLGLVVVTAGPLSLRPVTALPVQAERALALLVVGFVFALAYPRRILVVAAIVLGTTTLLELVQVLEPSRHGRIVDLSVKLIGAICGLLAGMTVNVQRRR